MTFSNELVTWGGNAWNSDLNEWVAVAVSIPMDGSRLGVYGSYEYIDGGLSDYVSNNNTAIVIDPTTPFTSTDGLVISSNSPYINFNDNNDSFFERYDLTTGLPGIVFGDGSEIAHPGIGRFAVDNGDNSRTLEAGMNGKFIYFNDNPSNNSSWIYVPANIDVPLPIGFTVTVVMGDFNSTSKVFVNNNGNGAVSFYVSGSSNFGQQSWSFGGDGKAGVYTIMKVDTDKWMLAGPNVQVD
jgi:hypothetical protein